MEPEDRVHAYLRILVENFYAFIIRGSKKIPFLMISPLYKEIAEHECFNSLMMAIANDGVWQNSSLRCAKRLRIS